jgi:hypothetical protein
MPGAALRSLSNCGFGPRKLSLAAPGARPNAAAEALSEALGGLPLAHEQAAAYCERLGEKLLWQVYSSKA